MNNQSIEELTIETLHRLKDAEAAVAPFNDYGSICGFREEAELIDKDIRSALMSARLRASRLESRATKFTKGEREVPLLKG